MIAASPFDAMAADYDRAFTQSAIGRRLRAATWRWLDAGFAAGDRVLELNCGTGEDALHLARRGVRVLATDRSGAMLAATRAKIAGAGLAGQVDTALLALEDVGQWAARYPRLLDGLDRLERRIETVPPLPWIADHYLIRFERR